MQLEKSMAEEIADGLVAVETQGNSVIVRLPEEIAFPSGSDQLSPSIIPILADVGNALQDSPGLIVVSGHTDDQPISSTEFRSNWELSTDRAVSVVHEFMTQSNIDPERLSAVGFADTRPLAPNDTPENRAQNRRVEISITSE